MANTQFTVSVHMLILIAVGGERRLTSEELAQSVGCNPVMVRQLYGKLKAAGLLRVTAGRGRTELAREPADITLWDVFAAAVGGRREDFFAFHPNLRRSCAVGEQYERILGAHLDDAMEALRHSMERVTLETLMRQVAQADEKTGEEET